MSTIKRGDTFSVAGYLPTTWPVGTWSARANLVSPNNIVVPLTVVLTPPAGNELRYKIALYLGATATAALEELGVYKGDIEFTNSAVTPAFVVSTDKFTVKITKDQTV